MTVCTCAQGPLCPEGKRLWAEVKDARAAFLVSDTGENYRREKRAFHEYHAHIAASKNDYLKEKVP